MAILLILLTLGAPRPALVIHDRSVMLADITDVSAWEFKVEPGNELSAGADWPYTFRVGEFVQGIAFGDGPIGLSGNIEIVKGRLRGSVSELCAVDSKGNEIPVAIMDLRRRYPDNERR